MLKAVKQIVSMILSYASTNIWSGGTTGLSSSLSLGEMNAVDRMNDHQILELSLPRTGHRFLYPACNSGLLNVTYCLTCRAYHQYRHILTTWHSCKQPVIHSQPIHYCRFSHSYRYNRVMMSALSPAVYHLHHCVWLNCCLTSNQYRVIGWICTVYSVIYNNNWHADGWAFQMFYQSLSTY